MSTTTTSTTTDTSSTPAPASATATATAAAASSLTSLTSNSKAAQVIDPATSIFVYIGVTAVYFVMKYMFPDKSTILFAIYFILILVSQFILNIYLAKQMCNSPSNVGTAAVATIIPWVLIFGLLNLLLTMFPGWLAAFSNTIGYAIASVFGVSSLFTEKLLNDTGKAKDKDAFIVIKNILSDPSTVINTLNTDNLVGFWNKSISVELFKDGLKQVDDNVTAESSPLFFELKQYIILKDLISYFIWYLLTGILITSISYNYMLTIPCVQTPKQARTAAAQFLANKNNAKTAADAAKSNAPVYKTDGK
jgi:hypothetical protein